MLGGSEDEVSSGTFATDSQDPPQNTVGKNIPLPIPIAQEPPRPLDLLMAEGSLEFGQSSTPMLEMDPPDMNLTRCRGHGLFCGNPVHLAQIGFESELCQERVTAVRHSCQTG